LYDVLWQILHELDKQSTKIYTLEYRFTSQFHFLLLSEAQSLCSESQALFKKFFVWLDEQTNNPEEKRKFLSNWNEDVTEETIYGNAAGWVVVVK